MWAPSVGSGLDWRRRAGSGNEAVPLGRRALRSRDDEHDMNTLFPALDPIPLPAPVWLFKGLHLLTLSLHFIAVEMLLGGLLLAVVLNLLGRGGDGEVARCRRNAAWACSFSTRWPRRCRRRRP